jgi:pyridoxine 5'-phosphate synthase PdxJ
MSSLNELVYYCKEANFFGALMLTGQWGCGKTYLIEHELVKELGDEYIIIRVSLFGESSIESINRKVQKEYFQYVMLHMGSYMENIAQRLPGMTDEKASELAAKTDKIAETVSGMATKVDGSKLGGVVRFVAGIAKRIPGAEKILSLSPSEYVSVENTIGDKKVILVFDDLERSNINEVDVLGCINEYCENIHIKTIIVANEDKIPENRSKISKESGIDASSEPKKPIQSPLKIKYSEIKEKVQANN